MGMMDVYTEKYSDSSASRMRLCSMWVVSEAGTWKDNKWAASLVFKWSNWICLQRDESYKCSMMTEIWKKKNYIYAEGEITRNCKTPQIITDNNRTNSEKQDAQNERERQEKDIKKSNIWEILQKLRSRQSSQSDPEWKKPGGISANSLSQV